MSYLLICFFWLFPLIIYCSLGFACLVHFYCVLNIWVLGCYSRNFFLSSFIAYRDVSLQAFNYRLINFILVILWGSHRYSIVSFSLVRIAQLSKMSRIFYNFLRTSASVHKNCNRPRECESSAIPTHFTAPSATCCRASWRLVLTTYS